MQPVGCEREGDTCAEGSVGQVAVGLGAPAAAAGASSPVHAGVAGTVGERVGCTAEPEGGDEGPGTASGEDVVVGEALGGCGERVGQAGVRMQHGQQQCVGVVVPQTAPHSEPPPCPLVVLCGSSFADDVDALLLDDE